MTALPHSSGFQVALMIAAIVTFATIGDLLIASAMRSLDLDAIRAKQGLTGAIRAVVTNARFCGGVLGMACGFFSLLYALSHADVSLIGPASASLTFVTNAFAARFVLKERVDRRRWAAVVFICLGVALLRQ